MVINGGNDGPLYVDPRNPSLAKNMKNIIGEIWPTCGKGILQNGNRGCLLILTIFFPCLICYLMTKKRKCTSCGQLFPNSCWNENHKNYNKNY